MEQHGYPPLLLDLESQDQLDHVLFLFRKRGRWGTIARSRDAGLHGRKPVFRTIRHLVMSYVDPYVDGKARVIGYGVADLRTLVKCDWRLSAKNVKEVERALIVMPHKTIRTSERRHQAILRQFQAFRKKHPDKPATFYSNRTFGCKKSEDQFQRELNLAGSSRGVIDDAETRTAQNVHGQPEVHQVEGVEELGAELQGGGLGPRAAAQRGVFDQSHVEIVIIRATEGVSSQGSEAALVGSGAARNVNGDGKEGGVVGAPAEVVLPNRASSGEVRNRDLIGPVRPRRSHAGLLNPGINRKRRAGGEGRNVEDLPALESSFFPKGRRKSTRSQRQDLNDAGRKRLSYVKG